MAGFERYRRRAAVCVLLALVSACVSAPKNPPLAPPAVVPAAPPLDPSYDWHRLLLVPFGSLLKEIPLTLHEVLLFRDAAHARQADDAECYAVEQTPPRFVARIPSEYTLCFTHDRLTRVQATVNVAQSEATQVFSDACGLWQRNAAAADAGAAHAGAAPDSCEGREGAIGYSGRLDQEAEPADASLSIDLDASVEP